MDVTTATVGLPVSDLDRAIEWYRAAFELPTADLEPAYGIVEFRLGPIWLQLSAEETARSGAEVVTRLGVADVAAERARLLALGIDVGPLHHVEGMIDYVDFRDPDGNALSLYTELS
ncbi:VOC family protein [Demequina lutea]|uniref:Catechol 2,3-dioxygenase-like lactoylglutathione lyase family enzyme n=1 Tax=Demequina lutea TaxID=431489 RepID=A0A7Y9ZCI6_9MICO|nr:VOC family protein [Demequina lutea]NYI42837.1 catechol 2,3-dioxygenase-like lactoylglutathione lyase family enzyme [Demequina lutea]